MTASATPIRAMQVEFTLTASDLVEANQIVLRQRLLSRKTLFVGMVAALAWVA